MLQSFSTPMLVVAVALIDRQGCVLMQRRRLGAAHGGLWEFPGGKVEAGECPEDAAVREIDEELGIAIEHGALTPVGFATSGLRHLESDRQRPGLVILLYICRHWAGEVECREGEEIRWCMPEDIGALAMPPLDYPLAQTLLAMLA
jgi:8-oxo-dGTP diphosphatase